MAIITDRLEASSLQQIQNLQGEEDVNRSGMEENHSSEVINKPNTKPETVHQFYFVKLWPFEDPDEASKIAEAEKLVEQLEQEFIRVNDKCKMLRPAWRYGWSQLRKSKNCPLTNGCGIQCVKNLLDDLQTALDKLNFANAHQGVANKSTFSTKQNTYHGFNRKMLHGSCNLAIERQLLRDIDRSQERLDYTTAPRLGLLHTFEYNLNRSTWWYNNGNKDKLAKYKKLIEKISQIEGRKQKALGDAIAKGESRDPLSAKRAIQEQIKIANQMLLELKRDHCEVMLEIERAKKQLDAFRKDAGLLIEQRREIRRARFEAQQRLLFLRQLPEKMNARYQEYYLSCMNKARELARTKDVASLRRFSQWQVKKFMSDWNTSRSFRNNYEISILPSIKSRGLNRDGGIKSNDDDDPCKGESRTFATKLPMNPVPIKKYATIYLHDSF